MIYILIRENKKYGDITINEKKGYTSEEIIVFYCALGVSARSHYINLKMVGLQSVNLYAGSYRNFILMERMK